MTDATRTIGFWMAIPIAVLQGVNAVRAVIDPAGFANYFGAPATGLGVASWVQVYGLRTAFIALLVTILLWRRNLEALKWIALAAIVMPLGDAFIAHGAGAGVPIVGRHLLIALYVCLTFAALAYATSGTARSQH